MDENEVVSYESMPQLHMGSILTKAQVEKLREPFKDVIVVVRCKDCKYHFVDGDNVRFNMCLLNHNKVQSDNWFCADGVRR